MPADETSHDEETQAKPRRLPLHVPPHPIEALEDLAQLALRDADVEITDNLVHQLETTYKNVNELLSH